MNAKYNNEDIEEGFRMEEASSAIKNQEKKKFYDDAPQQITIKVDGGRNVLGDFADFSYIFHRVRKSNILL